VGYIQLSVKIKGELPPDEEINTLMGIPATVIHRKGDWIGRNKKQVWKSDNWTLDLATDIDVDSTEDEIDEKFSQAEVLLRQIAPNIAALNRDCFSAAFYISCIREEDQGGLVLSQDLVSTIAMAELEIHVLVLVVFED
jgi:Domain of unknown function (DUF4279)